MLGERLENRLELGLAIESLHQDLSLLPGFSGSVRLEPSQFRQQASHLYINH